MSKKVTRLYDGFKPSNYKLNIELDPAAKKFSGSVVIKGKKVGPPSKRITFHQKDLKIKKAQILRHEKAEQLDQEVTRINKQKSYDEVRLHTKGQLYAGEYTVTIEFESKITDQMNGLYPCYFTHNNAEKFVLATQFESHHAREVFPCVDEPEAKATFDLTLTTPKDKASTIIANTPVEKEEVLDGKIVSKFQTTPVMSSYLLAFAYGEVGFKEAKSKNGTLIRTYATPDNVQFTDFALETAVKVLDFYEDYFDIRYPLAKCDMIALPDFAAGAMENWGLITYREQALLVDPKNTSLSVKQWVAMVVAHELAHQWFGNLVTMKWWTDLWLNEGFASWIEYLAVDHLFPEWEMWTQFIASEQQSALKLDALDNTHPIEAPINHPDEIRTIFDAISYNKGASVIHMLHGYLGPTDFRDGLRHYLKTHAYKNTQTIDLWKALEKTSGKPVDKFMSKWTKQPGFPLLSVRSNDKQIELSQERFFMQKPASGASSSLWSIPLLSKTEEIESLDKHNVLSKAEFSKLNSGQSGFYRTLYTPELLSILSAKVSEFEPLDRLGLLADSFDTSKAGYGSVVDSLKLLKEYGDEDNAAVWDIIAMNIGEIRRVMDDEELRELFKPFVIQLVSSQVKRLGFVEKKKESHFDKLLRPTVLGLAASSDEPKVVKWCQETFDKVKASDDIHPDLRSVVFNTVARLGDKKVYNKLMSFHNATTNSEERITLAAALTSFKQEELIDKSLKEVTGSNVRRQDAMYWVAYSFMNRHAKQATWQWMKRNWKWLDDELGGDLSFSRTPIYAARSFSDKEFAKDFSSFFAKHDSPKLERSIKQGKEMLDWQIAWKTRDLNKLKDFLS